MALIYLVIFNLNSTATLCNCICLIITWVIFALIEIRRGLVLWGFPNFTWVQNKWVLFLQVALVFWWTLFRVDLSWIILAVLGLCTERLVVFIQDLVVKPIVSSLNLNVFCCVVARGAHRDLRDLGTLVEQLQLFGDWGYIFRHNWTIATNGLLLRARNQQRLLYLLTWWRLLTFNLFLFFYDIRQIERHNLLIERFTWCRWGNFTILWLVLSGFCLFQNWRGLIWDSRILRHWIHDWLIAQIWGIFKAPNILLFRFALRGPFIVRGALNFRIVRLSLLETWLFKWRGIIWLCS